MPRGARSIAASSAPPAIETALEWAAPLSRSRAPADRGRITPILLHPRQPPAAPVPKIAIVIDDLGHNRAAAERAIALDRAVTLAFLPDAEAAAALAAEARAAGHEVLLHMPMEPIAGAADPGPNALRVGLVPAEVRRRLGWALSRVPGAIGLNNHMGSKFTADGAGMALVLVEAKERGLLFLDSRTTADSVGFSAAARIGLRRAARDVFLDNEVSTEAVAAQLAETERIATAQGSAIAIGHPHPATLAVLESWLPGLANRGFLATPITAVATADDPLLAESHQP